MTITRSTFTLAVRDHQLGARVHELDTITLECRSKPNGGTVIPGESIEALDAALAALRADLIKSACFYSEVALTRAKEGNENLFDMVDELDLSIRSSNCLRDAGIRYVYELVEKNGSDLLKIRYFGRKSLDEVKEVLAEIGLSLGMKLHNLPLGMKLHDLPRVLRGELRR